MEGAELFVRTQDRNRTGAYAGGHKVGGVPRCCYHCKKNKKQRLVCYFFQPFLYLNSSPDLSTKIIECVVAVCQFGSGNTVTESAYVYQSHIQYCNIVQLSLFIFLFILQQLHSARRSWKICSNLQGRNNLFFSRAFSNKCPLIRYVPH
jgi:hypothetical protein